MKIGEILPKIVRTKKRISSEKARMAQQAPEDLLFWTMVNDSDDIDKIKQLISILQADDWVVDAKRGKRG